MGKRITIQRTDDLNGQASDSVSTVFFGFEGEPYSIELNARNAETFRRTMQRYITAGRPAGVDRGHTAAVRDWAAENGFKVGARGRISARVLASYKASLSQE